ncbi:MAG: hypothetical protein RR247_02640 [Clostridia bacterium]
MDEIKNKCVIIGFFILVFFMAFCIGICFQNLKNKMDNILDGALENETIQKVNSINAEIEVYTNKIDEINNKKQALINQMASLNSTNEEQAALIKQYETQINDLNRQIVDLTQRLSDISKTTGNLTIVYKGSYNNIFYAIFDINNNYVYHTSFTDSKDYGYNYTGKDIVEIINNQFVNFENRIKKSIVSETETSVCVYDYYDINFDGQTRRIDIDKNLSYRFLKDANLSVDIIFNGSKISVEDLINSVDLYAKYEYQMRFNYSVNAENKIDLLTCNITVNTK